MPSRSHSYAVAAIWFDSLERRTLCAGDFRFEFKYPAISDVPAIATAVLAATARWEAILTADVPDVPRGPWGAAVDDIRLDVDVAGIDGPGGTLAYAEPHYKRAGSNLPIDGVVTIDESDANNPRLVDIITHEIGHVLGIGSSWSALVSDYGGTNPQYIGVAALAEYRPIAGNLSLTGVPVENTGNQGTRDVHWREATFFNELMTGFYNSSVVDPLSRLSAAALIDLGFPGVALEGTQPYNLPNGNPIPTIGSLTANAATTGPDESFTLTANNVADLGRTSDGAGAGVASVRFYRESNNIPGLQATGNLTNPDTLITTDTAAAFNAAISGLVAGTYTFYAQAVDVLGAVGGTASVAHVVTAPPPTPAAPILDAASDSGLYNNDGITNIARPTLRGTIIGAAAGTVIDVFADGVAIGTADVSNGAWSLVPGTPLLDGGHAITVVARAGSVSGTASVALNIVIDTVAPHASNARFESITRLGMAFDFDEDVSASVGTSDLTVLNTTTGLPATATLGSSTATTTFFAVPPLTLPAGDYTATLAAAGVTDIAGNALAGPAIATFFYLPGDINRSRAVDAADLAILSQHYGQAGNALDGDLDYSGVVDFADLVLLAQNFGTTLNSPKPITIVAKKTKPRTAIELLASM
jgi:hypothetical protein